MLNETLSLFSIKGNPIILSPFGKEIANDDSLESSEVRFSL